MNVSNDIENEKETKEAFPLPADLIRFVGVILVILLHASIESYTGLPLSALGGSVYWWTTTIYDSIARPAVSLFVMLTGALLLQPTKVNEPIKVFLKKRFSRIGYAFVFWTVVYLLWAHYVPGPDHTFYGQPLTPTAVIQGFLNGSYYHLWFLYLIAGLYLITPVLRVVATFGKQKILKYLILLWLIGVSVIPLIQLIIGPTYPINSSVFIIGGWIGYFLLGLYLQEVKLKKSTLYAILILGYFFTSMGTWLMVNPFHPLEKYYFFFDSTTINVIAASIALFLLLCRFPADWPGNNRPNLKRFVHAVSQNSLPIYLLQLIILESLHMGFFGFTISLNTINPIIEIPLVTVVTLFITLGLVLIMRKVPILNKLIG